MQYRYNECSIRALCLMLLVTYDAFHYADIIGQGLLDTYKGEDAIKYSEAWELAKENIKKAQQRQKKQYDRKTKLPEFNVSYTVFVYMPAIKACKAYKFARPFRPYSRTE